MIAQFLLQEAALLEVEYLTSQTYSLMPDEGYEEIMTWLYIHRPMGFASG